MSWTREEAKHDITERITIFYNRKRRAATLNYLAPAVFAKNYYEKTATSMKSLMSISDNRPHDILKGRTV